MKFTYHYKTKDGIQHDGVYAASSKTAVYDELKKKGIKPFGVELAPGLFNKIASVGKRWLAIGLLTPAFVAILVAWYFLREKSVIYIDAFEDTVRRQVIGDAATIERGVQTGWADVFDKDGERFLAAFAIPGSATGMQSVPAEEILASLGREIGVTGADSLEARQIKAMVKGMKSEMRDFLAAGGSVAQYGRLLVARQREEVGYYNRVQNEIEKSAKTVPYQELVRLWEKRNRELRGMGIKTVTFPDVAEP